MLAIVPTIQTVVKHDNNMTTSASHTMRFASGFDRLGRYLAASTDNHQHSQLLLPTVQWSEMPKWMILVAADRKLTRWGWAVCNRIGPKQCLQTRSKKSALF
jgi:hypothetical protein